MRRLFSVILIFTTFAALAGQSLIQSINSDSDGGKLLKTANWGQDYPFNSSCPEINGQRSLAGCGAVAMAIIMKYHNWPEHGVSNHSYLREGNLIGYDFANARFQFDKMPDNVTTETTTEEIDAISNLIFAAGISIGTDYDVNSSTHASGFPAYALSYFFDYSPDCQSISTEGKSIEEIVDITINQIDKGLPVLYTGSPIGMPSGHVWVVDGYNEDKTKLHCNFGFSGDKNGYYSVDELLGSFLCDGIIINIYPNRQQAVNNGVFMGDDTRFYIPGIRVSRENIEPNIPFEVSVEDIIYVMDNGELSFGVALADKSDKIKEMLYEHKLFTEKDPNISLPIVGTKFAVTDVKIKTTELNATDSIKLFSKRGENGTWQRVPCNVNVSSASPLRGNKCKSSIFKFRIADNLKVSIAKTTPNGFGLDVTNGQEISTIDYGGNVFIEPTQGFTDHRIKCTVNEIQRGTMFNFWGRSTNGYTFTIETQYTDEGRATLAFNDINTSGFDIDIDYVKLSVPLSIVNITPGNLHSLIPQEVAATTNDLTIKGSINASDIWFIANNFPILEYLDLSESDIEECIPDDIPSYEKMLNPSQKQSKDMWPDYGLVDMFLLRDIKLPNSLKSLGFWPLTHCSNLTRLELPAGISKINAVSTDNASLWIGDRLQKIISLNPEPPLVDDGVTIFNANTNENTPNNGILFVPAGSVEAYRNANGWSLFNEIYPLDKVELTLDKSEISLSGSDVAVVTANLISAQDLKIKWNNSNPDILSINCPNDRDCYISGHKNGSAIITATVEVDGSNLSASCVVTVSESKILISSMTIEPSNINGKVGETSQLIPKFTPDNATQKDVVWSSDNPSLASVDSNGLVTLLAKGNTIVRASTIDGSDIIATCNVVIDDSSNINEIEIDSDTNVIVYDIHGHLVYKGVHSEINLSPGIYIFKYESHIVKRIVR